MLLSVNIKPDKDVYYLGAKVIEILNEADGNRIDFFDAFQKLNSIEKISMNLFVLSVDWLYILGVIKQSNDKYIEKCF
ncbi:MAG: hypothetical protein JRJ44_09290 [Deltaproteobacteria bacterium]|nr:hypothetical protein [Deltaproteobacteria bacterium]